MSVPTPSRDRRFAGRIAGWGTASGGRFVLGAWHTSPLGAFADVMVERSDGARVLLAPTWEVAEFVATTYTFDDVVIAPVRVGRGTARDDGPTTAGERWEIEAGPLSAQLEVGRRAPLGWVLRALPRRLSGAPALTWVSDPVARVLLRGVRTRGSARAGRTEFYGASDLHRLVSAVTRWDHEDLGPLRPLEPPVRFGFGSSPRGPSITDLVTTVRGI